MNQTTWKQHNTGCRALKIGNMLKWITWKMKQTFKNEPRVQTPRATNNQDASVFITCWAFETANDPSTPVGRICLQCLCRKMQETSTQCHTPQKALNGKPCSILQGPAVNEWASQKQTHKTVGTHCWRFETDGPAIELFARFVRVKSTISTNYEHNAPHTLGRKPRAKSNQCARVYCHCWQFETANDPFTLRRG